MGRGQWNAPPTATQDGLPQSSVGHVEHVGPIGQHVDVTQHGRTAKLLANLSKFPAEGTVEILSILSDTMNKDTIIVDIYGSDMPQNITPDYRRVQIFEGFKLVYLYSKTCLIQSYRKPV